MHRIFDGTIAKGDSIVSCNTRLNYEISEVGILSPTRVPTRSLSAGHVGYIICGMKNMRDSQVGDTWYRKGFPVSPYPGFEVIQPMVYVSAYPAESDDFSKLQESINKLTLNDRSIKVQRETSIALGQGFRLGFLGPLHVSVTIDRLHLEHDADVLVTAPTVPYKLMIDGQETMLTNANDHPTGKGKYEILEPMVLATMIFPYEYLGPVIDLCEQSRGIQLEQTSLSMGRCLLRYNLPLAQIVVDFFSRLKSRTQGYATLDYEDNGYQPSDLLSLRLLVNGAPVDALSSIVHRSEAEALARYRVRRLADLLDRQLYEIVIQAAVGTKILARETLRANRKDVTAKLYGGDHTRRQKVYQCTSDTNFILIYVSVA